MVINLSNETCPQGEVVRMTIDGRLVGDELTDAGWIQEEERKEEERRRAAEREDAQDVSGARWHDTIHLAFAACLGWSPVLRNLIGVRRHAHPGLEAVEDGDAAILAEEAIAWAVFCYVRNHASPVTLDGALAPDLLAYVRGQAEGFEVAIRTEEEWTRAIHTGIAAMQAMWADNGGTLVADLQARTLDFQTAASDRVLATSELASSPA
jgi:hypothetical protein